MSAGHARVLSSSLTDGLHLDGQMFALRRSTLAVRFQTRAFVASPSVSKTITETAKEVAEKANRVAGDAVLGAIKTGESASENVKQSASPLMDTVKDVSGS